MVNSGRDGREVGGVFPVGSSRAPGQRGPHSRNRSLSHPLVSDLGEKKPTGVGTGVEPSRPEAYGTVAVERGVAAESGVTGNAESWATNSAASSSEANLAIRLKTE